jgi:hypothetical protein
MTDQTNKKPQRNPLRGPAEEKEVIRHSSPQMPIREKCISYIKVSICNYDEVVTDIYHALEISSGLLEEVRCDFLYRVFGLSALLCNEGYMLGSWDVGISPETNRPYVALDPPWKSGVSLDDPSAHASPDEFPKLNALIAGKCSEIEMETGYQVLPFTKIYV